MIGEQLEVRLLSAKPTLVCKQHPYAEMWTGTVSGRQFATCAQCSQAHSAQWWTEEAREQELEDRAKQLYAKKVS